MTEADISDDTLERLRRDAAVDGDYHQVELCDRALHGDERARKSCAIAVEMALAARGSE